MLILDPLKRLFPQREQLEPYYPPQHVWLGPDAETPRKRAARRIEAIEWERRHNNHGAHTL